jgi:hypothetical protein
MPKFFKIVEHDHRKITISSATFHIFSHQCACNKAMNVMVFFSTISNVDGQMIMMATFVQFLATLIKPSATVHPTCIGQA